MRPLAVTVALALALLLPPVEGQGVEAEKIADGLVSAIEVAVDGTILFGSLDGEVKRLDAGEDAPVTVHEAPATRGPEWGLFDVAMAPDFLENGTFFVDYVTGDAGVDPTADDATGTVFVARVEGGEATVIYSYPATPSHNGGRLLVHDGLLFASDGDHDRGENAQDPSSTDGKILRMTFDGAPAPGNPRDEGIASWNPYAYSMGHRNPYGLAWDDVRDALVSSENGEYTADELNVVEKGGDHGWPVCEGFCHAPTEGLVDPVVEFSEPTIAPVGVAVVAGEYYVGAFMTKEIRRVWETDEGWRQETVFTHDSGLLDVEASPDGAWLYFGSWNGLWRVPAPEPHPLPTALADADDGAAEDPAAYGGDTPPPSADDAVDDGNASDGAGDPTDEAAGPDIGADATPLGALAVVAALGLAAAARRILR